MAKQISVESNLLIAESNGKSIAELMDNLIIPAKLAEIAEKSSPSRTEWNPKTILEIDRSEPESVRNIVIPGLTRNLFK